MKIIITNVYCYQNKGDSGIILSMIENLQKIFDNPEIKLVSLYPNEDMGKYGKNVEVLSPIMWNNGAVNKYILALRNIMKLLMKWVQYSMGIFISETEKEIASADLIVSCGGGYMQSRDIKKLVMCFSYHYIQLLCAKKSKRKYVIFAQSIGPFDFISAKVVREILQEASLTLARECYSYEYVQKKFRLKNLHLTADTAFLLKAQKNSYEFDNDKKRIGITVRNWIYPNSKNKDKMNERYINAFAHFINVLVAQYDMHVYIMPQCTSFGLDNDLIISQCIYEEVENHELCTVIEQDFTPYELKHIYSKMDYFIGTRMHSNIFSLAEYVPCIAISYEHKTDGIMESVGLKDYVININDISYEVLIEKFNALIEDKEISLKLKDSVDRVKIFAKKNYELIKDIADEG